jgi:type I restriction enzyme S subunit
MGKAFSFVEFGEIAEFRNGMNFSKNSHGKGCWLIGVSDFQKNFTPDYDTLEEINPEGITKKDDYLKKGDIIFVRSNGNKALVGRSLYIDRDVNALFSGFCIRARLVSDIIDPLFLAYYTRTEHFKSSISSVAGTNINNLNQDILSNVKLPLYPKNVQSSITNVLSALDAKIEINERINAELESMAKTLYDYWFVQFDFPNEKGKLYRSAGGKMVWNEELKRDIPLGWEVCELRKYATSNRGVSYSGKDIVGGGVPMINLNSFNMTGGSYKSEGIKTYSGDYGEHKILKSFDLVMCNTQQTALDPKKDIIGKSFLVPDIFDSDVVSSHHVTTITVNKESLKYYLNSLFNTEYFHRYISGYATGTNILGLNFEGVLSFKTTIPNDDLLEKYKAIAVNVEKQKARIIKENQTLTELRDWLLPMLMNGQVKVQG